MNPAPRHTELSEHLNAFLDGELEVSLRTDVEAHLAECAVCQLELEQLRQTKAALEAVSMLRAPRSFALTADAISSPAYAGAAAPVRRWLDALAWAWRVGAAAACACLVLAFVSQLGASPAALTSAEAPSSAKSNAATGAGGAAPAAASDAQRAAAQPANGASATGGANAPRAAQPAAPAPGLIRPQDQSQGATAPPAFQAAPTATPTRQARAPVPGTSAGARWLTAASLLAVASLGALFAERWQRSQARRR